MTIQKILMCAGLFSVAVAMLALIVPVCNAHGFHPMQDLLRGYRALPWYARVFLTLFTMVFILHGSTKTNTPPSGVEGGVTNAPWAGEGEMPTNTPPSLMMMAWRGTRIAQQEGGEGSGTTGFTEAQIAAGAAVVGVGTGEAHGFAPPEGAHVVERWRLRGAADERVRIVEGVEIDTFGRIRMAGRVFAPLGIQLGMVPEANWERIGRPSLAWWMHTESNSTVVCWMNALLNRDTNTPVCVMAEFQDNGKFEYRYDLSSVGEGATNVFARIVTTNGVEEVGLVAGVTSVRGHLLRPEDAWDSDRDRDGVTTHDEIFVYGTDPDLPDTDGDGRTDGEEIFVNGGDPLVGEAADAETLQRIAAGETNGPCVIVEGELNSTKLWDGFALAGDPGTNALYARTFAVDRKRGWTSFFISGRGEAWCRDGKDAIRSWSLEGLEIAWADDTGRSEVATASPHDDTLLLPLATNATSVTVTLRAVGTGRRASPRPLYLLEYTPKVIFPGSQEIAGNDGNGYCVYTDSDEMSFALDRSNRPCLAPPGEGEATEDDFALPTGTGVYALPTCETVEPDARPRLLAAPPTTPPGGGGRYLVVLDPRMTYGNGHYGANYWYPFDWWWLWWWGCTCEPEIYCGVIGYRAVQCYIEYDDGDLAEGVICVGGTEVWSGEARHNVWSYYPYDGEGYCPCGCEKGCPHCSCKDADGPSQGSVRFRVGLGEIDVGRTAGFAWFESDGPVEVTPRLFAFSPSPGTELSVSTNGEVVTCETLSARGNDLHIEPVTNGVLVTVASRRTAETNAWEITNVGGDSNVVRFVKRDLADGVCEDWTYVCRWEGGEGGRGREGGVSDDGGEWVWEATDNLAHGHVSAELLVWTEDGTNWVYDADGRLQRLMVGTNGVETVVRTFAYDGDGRIVRIDDGTNGCVTLAYDGNGNVSEMTGPEGTLRAAWDADGTLTNLDASAWSGEVPDARPRRLLMGAPGGGITPASALAHFLDGTGTPMAMPFSALDTAWLSPCEFGGVRSFVSSCHEPGSYPVSGTRVIATKGSQQYFLGHVTVAVEGTVTYTGHCNWTFSGTMRALDDEYNFNAANRGQAGETLTKIGRALFQAHGKPFAITFAGTKPLVGSGHCGD